MEIDVEVVDGGLVVGKEAAVARNPDGAHGVHVDFIGVRRKIVLVSHEKVADGDDRFFAFLEAYDFVGQFLKLAQPSARQAGRVQHQRLDAIIVSGSAYGIDQILEQGFAHVHALCLREGALQQPARELLDQGAFRRHHQRRLSRNLRLVPGDACRQDANEEEQEDQVQYLPDAVGRTPNAHQQISCQSAYVH